MRKLLLTLSVVATLTLPMPAQAEDPTPPNPITMGKGPKEGDLVPAWIFYWLLGGASVVSSGLLWGLRTLWSKLDEERKARDAPGLTAEERTWLKVLEAKNEDGVPLVYAPRALPEMIAKLTELAQDALERLESFGDAREDRQSLRTAFDAEKGEMREIYTKEIRALQSQLTEEQQGRRKETQDLWEKNDATTREVMSVIKDMILTLENASKVIDRFNEANDE